MKKYLLIAIAFFYMGAAGAQVVLPVPVTIQEHDQWCWAGCTKCILNYYGDSISQCQIAEYVRTVATWNNFGTTNCCIDATVGCNYWNYNSGQPGSIQDILEHFDGLTNYIYGVLTLAQMDTENVHHFPFVCHWSWATGGGHFVVGSGVDAGSNIHYMNPWFGEGAGICVYSWMITDGSHTYDGTNVISVCPFLSPGTITGATLVTAGSSITLADTAKGGAWSCSNSKAKVSASGVVTGMSGGWDTVSYSVTNGCGTKTTTYAVHVKSSVGVNTVNAAGAEELQVYPNPNTGSFNINLISDNNEQVEVTVYNVIGSLIKTFHCTANGPVKVDLDQPAGIYLVTATTTQGRYVARVLLNR
jgi:hypothetical protein